MLWPVFVWIFFHTTEFGSSEYSEKNVYVSQLSLVWSMVGTIGTGAASYKYLVQVSPIFLVLFL